MVKTRFELVLPILCLLFFPPFFGLVTAQPRFGLHASLAIDNLEGPRLSNTLKRYILGSLEQNSWHIDGGIAADAEIHPNVRLSIEVRYLSCKFVFHPDLAYPIAMATWDVSLFPLVLHILYSSPYGIGPAIPFVSLGGGYVFSAVNVSSNYGLITPTRSPTASFSGVTNGSGGWTVDARTGIMFFFGQRLWLEAYAGYRVSSTLSSVEMVDLETGFRTVDIDIRSYTIGLILGWFFI